MGLDSAADFLKEKKEKKSSKRSRGSDDTEATANDNEAPRRKRASAPDAVAAVQPQQQRSHEAFCTEHGMLVSGPPGFVVPAPFETFAATPFAPALLKLFAASGFNAPTVTQALAWPLALSGANVVTVAKTGSGKTLGFLAPIFHSLRGGAGVASIRAAPGRPSALVLAPTRELACQTEVEAARFGASLNLRAACVYGGAPKSAQIRALRDGVDIVIGTPGRLQDLMEMRVLSLDSVRFLVLDEADRMLDMGFEEPIRAIVAASPASRQTLLFTATWPTVIQRLAEEVAPRPVRMSVGSADVLAANMAVTQKFTFVRGDGEKSSALQDLFTDLCMTKMAGAETPVVRPDHGKVIVFVKFKQACNKVAQLLWDAGFAVNTLHGDMEQRERTRVTAEFRTGALRVLVATDVAARGLDVKDVTDVINYDFPFGKGGVEDYVHRIGRTGRAGATGTSHTFFDGGVDGKNASGLVALLQRAKQPVPEQLTVIARSSGGRAGGSSSGGRFGGRGGGGRFGGGGGYGGGYGGGGGFAGRRQY